MKINLRQKKIKILLNAVSNNEEKQQILASTDRFGFNTLIYAETKPKTMKALLDDAGCDTISEMAPWLAEYKEKLSDFYRER